MILLKFDPRKLRYTELFYPDRIKPELVPSGYSCIGLFKGQVIEEENSILIQESDLKLIHKDFFYKSNKGLSFQTFNLLCERNGYPEYLL